MAVAGNLISVSMSTEDLQKLDEAIQTIETVITGKTRNLSEEERRQFGRIAEQNKLFVNKAKDYMEEYPQHIPAFLDKQEFDRDFEARKVIEKRLIRLEGITEQLSDTKILLDNDNYTNALTFYRNIRFLSGEDVPGTTSIAKDLSQFFPHSKKKAEEVEEKTEE